jgi:hypothetical protein
MSITFWFSFLFAAPPQQSACVPQGKPLLEMRDRSETSTASTTTTIFESGAWTVSANGRTESGCFDRKGLRAIRSAVQHAEWKVTTSPIACFAYDPNFTEWYVHGKLRFTEQMCSGKTADFETMQAIDLVKKELAEDRAPAPTPPPAPAPTPLPPLPAPSPPTPLPPVLACRASGAPLFEIRHRSDMAEPTSTTSIYSNGAWTFQPYDKDGHAAAVTSGCLDKKTTMSLRDVINQSPWDTTFLRIVCKAYSPSFTEYYVHGQLEYTARLCGAQRLDEKSLGAIKIIENELATVLPKA